MILCNCEYKLYILVVNEWSGDWYVFSISRIVEYVSRDSLNSSFPAVEDLARFSCHSFQRLFAVTVRITWCTRKTCRLSLIQKGETYYLVGGSTVLTRRDTLSFICSGLGFQNRFCILHNLYINHFMITLYLHSDLGLSKLRLTLHLFRPFPIGGNCHQRWWCKPESIAWWHW